MKNKAPFSNHQICILPAIHTYEVICIAYIKNKMEVIS